MATETATATTAATATKSITKIVVEEPPVDQVIENLIRNTEGLSITKVFDVEAKLVTGLDPEGLKILPKHSKQRMVDGGIDISQGYPEIPNRDEIPVYVDQAQAIRDETVPYIERGKGADPEKKALFSAATEVFNLTDKIGTEIVGLQLKDLTSQQKDELALLIAERGVVFFRDQKLPPKTQWELGDYFGNIEVHPQSPHVPGLPGATVIWNNYFVNKGLPITFENSNLSNWDHTKYLAVGNQGWHADLTHEHQTAGYTHLHLDTVPDVGGDTLWSSSYAAYDKLSEPMKKFLDDKKAVYVSAHAYLKREDPFGANGRIERVHPLVRTHPATGWKYLFFNKGLTKRILGLSPVESDLIMQYLSDIHEKNADLQVRFNWKTKPGYGTSAIWDNRITQHRNIWDDEGKAERHGVRVTSLAEVPYFDPESKSQREALELPIHKWD